jgi:penicillin-binding protein 1A
MKDAVLAIEDAASMNMAGSTTRAWRVPPWPTWARIKSQGASTITMQVARNVYLSSEKTYTRKIYEILLTFKLEHMLTKDQILEIYMNQIFLGNRPTALPLRRGLLRQAAQEHHASPKPPCWPACPRRRRPTTRSTTQNAPRHASSTSSTAWRKTASSRRAGGRRQGRKLALKHQSATPTVHAEYVAETVRQLMFAQYGAETYTRGLNVYTTCKPPTRTPPTRRCAAASWITSAARSTAAREVRRPARRCRKSWTTPSTTLLETPDNGDVMAAVVLEANPQEDQGHAPERRGHRDHRRRPQTGPVRPVGQGAAQHQARRGAVIRVVQTPRAPGKSPSCPRSKAPSWRWTRDGAIKALVGGFDFDKNKFNHVTQAWRQPGSSFKPFIYSAALEKGFTPATVINDAPLFFDAGVTGGQPWEPKNYDGKFEGPMTCARGWPSPRTWSRSASCRPSGRSTRRTGSPASALTPTSTRLPDHGAGRRLGHADADGHGLFGVCQRRLPRQPVADHQGHRPAKGKVLVESQNARLDESMRAIDARNAFVMNSLLQEVTRSGTAAARRPPSSARPVRQDRHHQRLDGRLVCRLPAHAGGGGVDRLRHARASWATAKPVAA